MIKQRIVLMTLCAAIACTGLGQSPLTFRSTAWLGLASGGAGNDFQLQTVDGVARGPWFAGAGIGIDYYRFRSVPLFLSVTRDIATGKHEGLYLFLDGGTNLPWYKRPVAPNPVYGGILSSKFHSGEYWSGGVGYIWKLGDRTNKALLLSAGYTVKKLSEDQTAVSSCPFGAPCPADSPEPVGYDYLCRTYQFMVGFRF